ncbi:hypothetical protein FQJ95_09445 [Xanthomonas vasicola]|nr:hypothetical protein NX81_006780 [Xanthomonas vasicola]TWQ35914.1 hypothetical protein FQJ96_16980 [Xanthomonas vasicola]TWQ52833.1 hypothetical protein FQJ94_15685 [Xanthomonas vasicola]TWQ56368.1 hypothetical protein FQJ93_16260 [Xanthomonas vasicola]TWQ62503.1 hypothetical protein FQJ90_17805 [Xanthomonas vasicola]
MKKSPSNGAGSLQRSAGAKGRLEPLDQRLWKHVGGGDYPPPGANDHHDPTQQPPPKKGKP